MSGILLILATLMVAQGLVTAFGLPVPASVIAMLLMFALLLALGTVPKGLRQCSDLLLKALPLCLVPAGVGVMMYLDLIADRWLPLLLVLSVSTFVAQCLVMLTLKYLAARRKGGQ